MSAKRIGLYLSIVVALLGLAAQGTIHLPLGIPVVWEPVIQSWASFLLTIYVVVNPFLPADVVGPLAKPAAPLPATVAEMKATQPK